MSISNVNGALSAYQYAGKTQKTSAKEATYIEKTSEMSEAEEMATFKKEFYIDLEKFGVDRTISNVAINISEEAFKNMKADPEYREKVLAVIKRDLSASVAPAPNCSLLITVGATLKDYRADAWSVNNDTEFYARSQNSFYKRSNEKKDKTKEINVRYLEKRAQTKKLQEKILKEDAEKQELEHSRLIKAWYGEGRMTQASAAYEANVLVEQTGSSVFESVSTGTNV